MKTSNYFAKLPQEASIKSIQTFRDYDLITLNLPAPRQRLCPRCGSINCVILQGNTVAPYLLEAYEALQFFHNIQASSPFSVQSEELTEWIRKYASSRVEEIRSAAYTIRHWRSYIQNSWKYGKSNGVSEG